MGSFNFTSSIHLPTQSLVSKNTLNFNDQNNRAGCKRIINPWTGYSRYTRFRYPRFYFSVIRSINILSAATVEAAAKAHWVARAVSLTRPTILTPGTTNKGLSWCITQKIHRHLYVSRFTRFQYTRRYAGTQPPRFTRVTCNPKSISK
jgi:hypothetical protein